MKKTDEFLKLTSKCTHENVICRDCTRKELLKCSNSTNNNITCFAPICNEIITSADIRRVRDSNTGIASNALQSLNTLCFSRSAAENIPGFQWCKNGIYNCGSGQVHVDHDGNAANVEFAQELLLLAAL
ncbi:8423_t:CDS:2 [Cetraspora pellucida]|uniref:8423_t:CDS:1 n=1 Tax=Cetraspora pellucida TaxID=1433469 RepID=A0A9N9IZW6_9GLOM|nr:8423_t:CDS:2 [Cetraspora pellucida]